MSRGRVLHGSLHCIQLLRYEGDIKYPISPAVDGYIQQLLQRDDICGFVVDLTATEMLDSTHLGILARLARAMQKRGLPKVTLISDREDINELLEALGFERVFNVVHTAVGALESLDEIALGDADPEELKRILVDSHRALSELTPEGLALFRDVVAEMEQDSD